MTFSGRTNEIRRSDQFSSRQGAAIDHIILHHSAAFDVEVVLGMMVNDTREVSSNYVVANDGTVFGVVDEENRAWTSGSSSDGGKGAAFDRRSITFEVLDQTGAPDWLISGAAQESVAQVIADVANRYGFDINGDTVLGHRDLYTRFGASYATACPGGMDIAWIINRARALRGQAPVATISGSGSSGSGGSFDVSWNGQLTADIQLQVQTLLKNLGFYSGDLDGAFGPISWAAIQAYLQSKGYYKTGNVDGDPGPLTCAAIQELGRDHGGYTGDMDNALGSMSWGSFIAAIKALTAPPVVAPPVVAVPPVVVPPVTVPPSVVVPPVVVPPVVAPVKVPSPTVATLKHTAPAWGSILIAIITFIATVLNSIQHVK